MPFTYPFANTEQLKRAKRLLNDISKERGLPAVTLNSMQDFLRNYEGFKYGSNVPADMIYVDPNGPAPTIPDISYATEDLHDFILVLEHLKANPQIIPHKQAALVFFGEMLNSGPLGQPIANAEHEKLDIIARVGLSLGIKPKKNMSHYPLHVNMYLEAGNIFQSPKRIAGQGVHTNAQRVLDKFNEATARIDSEVNYHYLQPGNSVQSDAVRLHEIAKHNLSLYVSILKYLQVHPEIFKNDSLVVQQALEEFNKCFIDQEVFSYEAVFSDFKKPHAGNITLEEIASKLGMPNDPKHGYNYILVYAEKPIHEQYPANINIFMRIWNGIKDFFAKLFPNVKQNVIVEKSMAATFTDQSNKSDSKNLGHRIKNNLRKLYTPKAKNIAASNPPEATATKPKGKPPTP